MDESGCYDSYEDRLLQLFLSCCAGPAEVRARSVRGRAPLRALCRELQLPEESATRLVDGLLPSSSASAVVTFDMFKSALVALLEEDVAEDVEEEEPKKKVYGRRSNPLASDDEDESDAKDAKVSCSAD